jgi:hypothetical protein
METVQAMAQAASVPDQVSADAVTAMATEPVVGAVKPVAPATSVRDQVSADVVPVEAMGPVVAAVKAMAPALVPDQVSADAVTAMETVQAMGQAASVPDQVSADATTAMATETVVGAVKARALSALVELQVRVPPPKMEVAV